MPTVRMATLTSCLLPGVSRRTWGRPFTSQTACSLVFLPPLVMPMPWAKAPLCASGGAVGPGSGPGQALDAGAVDEQLGGNVLDPGKLGEDTFPYGALGPAPDPVIERLRPVDMLRAIAPAPSALQSMDDIRKHAPVIDPWQSPAYHAAGAAQSTTIDYPKTRRNPPRTMPPRWRQANHIVAPLGIAFVGLV